MLTLERFKQKSSTLKPVNQHVHVGSSLTLVGPAASGKTELALALSGLKEHWEFEGRALLDELEVSKLPPGQKVREFGWLPSDPTLIFSGIKATVREELLLSLQVLQICEDERLIETLISGLELKHLLERDPFTLSGGEAVRAALAMILVKRPQILVIDQTLEFIYPVTRDAIWKFIEDVSWKMCTIELSTRFSGRQKEQHKDVLLSDAYNASLSKFSAQKQSLIGQRNINLKVQSLRHNYEEGFALGPIDLALKQGDCVAIVGPNGAGKSTLLKSLAGLVDCTWEQFEVVTESDVRTPPSNAQKHVWATTVRLAFQNPDDQLYGATVEAELAPVGGHEGNNSADRIQDIANTFEIGDLLDASPLDLPRSQRRLVAIAAVFASEAPILLLDEPTVGLDVWQAELLIKAIDRSLKQGKTILLVSHDRGFVEAVASKRIAVDHGYVTSIDENKSKNLTR